MDLIIRQNLSTAETQQDTAALLNAYKLIKDANEDRYMEGAPENFSPDLYVLCAEHALKFGNPAVGADCLQMYFKNEPPPNQFYGRAYLCKAQLHAPQAATSMEELEKSVAYYLKAISFAKQQERYHFLVYNASVLYWQMVRPFLKPERRHLLIPSLSAVVKALEEINECDKDWRAELMMELLDCMLDAPKTKQAADFAASAAEYIKINVPHKYPQLFSKMVHHKLIDSAKAGKVMKTSVALSVIHKIQKLRLQLGSNLTTKDIFTNLNDTYKLLSTLEEESPPRSPGSQKTALLIELARLAMAFKCSQLASSCIQDLKNTHVTDPQTLLILQCLQSELEVLNAGSRTALYTKSTVEAQLKVIQRLDSVLEDALRVADPSTIQIVCTTQWNLCLPLLQHNLRKHVRKPLIAICEALETIDSLLTELRCQIHLEVAHIEEDEDRIEAALQHIQKALLLNNGGQYKNFLEECLHRLQLRTTLYKKPERSEDQATMIIEQAKQCNSKDSVRMKRSLLVNAGICLAPDVFQMVLDSENEARVSTGKRDKGRVSFLCSKAQHHSKCVRKAEGHLKRVENKNDRERVRLWAELAKVARRQEVWDVCRAACRFCLLYDDGRWNITTYDALKKKKSAANVTDEGRTTGLESESPKPKIIPYNDEITILRTLAEIRFINAEATIHLLKSEGSRLNDAPVPPEDSSTHPVNYIAANLQEHPEWIVYKDWISQLSKYATDNFLQAAQLGVELNEPWITHNAAVYILNHNKHLIVAGRLSELADALQKLLAALKITGNNGNPVLFLMLSNALAKGLILRWIPVSKASKRPETSLHSAKDKKSPRKGSEKSPAGHVLSIDPAGLPDVKLALEVCDYALELTNGNKPEEVVPIAVRHQLISTWVKAKQLYQQQIGPKLGTDDEDNNEGQNQMTKVLVALEMLSCNGLGLMDFTVPSLSQVYAMASECTWSDALVELQSFTRLAHFAHISRSLDLALTCTRKALQFDKKTSPKKKESRDSTLEREMLSVASCIQGQCIMDNLAGEKLSRLSAMNSFQLSARLAGDAGNPTLTLQAASYFWHACLPLIKSAKERAPLKEATVSVIKAIADAETNHHQLVGDNTYLLHLWPSVDVQSHAADTACETDRSNEELGLRSSLYELLFTIHADKEDWESGLKVLDEAISTLPRTKHRLNIFKHRVLVKARRGENFLMDVQKFKDEEEECLSQLWHQAALASRGRPGRLACYQNAIDVLQKPDNQWQKVDHMLEMAGWLFCNEFPLSDALSLLHWAVDILLQMKFYNDTEEGKSQKGKTKPRTKSSLSKDRSRDEEPNAKPEDVDEGRGASSPLEDLRNVRQLEGLARAYTLMAVISGRMSPEHEDHCLMAYTYILRIWQVSLPAAGSFIKQLPKIPLPVQNPHSASSQREKGKKDASEHLVAKEKSKRKGHIDIIPSNPEEWANFDCPGEIREAFKLDTSYHVINLTSLTKPTYSLYFLDLLVKELQGISFPHLTFPVLHLAEVIAHDVIASESLSDLYHLRISQVCNDLKLYQAAAYHQKRVGNMYISEQDQISCRQDILLIKKEKQDVDKPLDQHSPSHLINTKPKVLGFNADGSGLSGLSFPYLWLEKADTLIELGFYQPARHLLAEAYQAFQAIGDKSQHLKCLCSLALLANSEKNHGQAKTLLMEDQETERDAEMWYKSTLTMTDAVLGEMKEGGEKKACAILETTISVFKDLLQKQSNRQSECGFYIAALHARKFSIVKQTAKNLIKAGNASSQTIVTLLDICDKMSQTEADLIRYGLKEQRADLMAEHSDILRILANLAEDEERKHRYYLDAYAMAESAVNILEQAHYNIRSLFSLREARSVSLPIMRDLVKSKLRLAELCLEAIELVTTEDRRRLQEERRKGPLRVVVEEYVRATPDYSSIEEEWNALGRTIGSIALTQLESVPRLLAGCADLKAKCLYLTGKCLRLLSVKADPLPEDAYWNDKLAVGTHEESQTTAITRDNERLTANLHLTKKQQNQFARKTAALQRRRAAAKMYLAQSSETLLQCVACAIRANLVSTLSEASLQMAACLGQFDPSATGQCLALYQSCSTSLLIRDLVSRATRNTSNSQFAALLNLQQRLHEKGNLGHLYKMVEKRLCETSKVWEQLQINPRFFNIINEVPPNFNIFILQHSEDRSFLYGALLEKPKINTAQKGKLTQPKASAKVVRWAVDPRMLGNLLERMEQFRHDMMQLLRKKDYQRSSTRQRNVFEKIQEVYKASGGKEDEQEKKLGSAYNEIIHDMEAYLNPVLQQLDFSSFRQQSPPHSTTESARAKFKEREEKPTSSPTIEIGHYIVLLADSSLMELPLEALSVFQEEGIGSVSRDFSLQLLYNRIHRAQTEGDDKRDLKSPKETKPKSEQRKPVSTMPPSRILPPNCMSVDTHHVRYIVDPYNEAQEPEGQSPGNKINEVLGKYSQQFTPHWEGIIGSTRVPSYADWETLFTNCSAFLFYGAERFLSYLLLDRFLALNLTECQLVILLDLVQTKQSFSRQSKADVEKTEMLLALERPVETAILLSVTGVRAVMLNQWHATLAQNADKLDLLSENLLELGRTTGQTICSQRRLGQDPGPGKVERDISTPPDMLDEGSVCSWDSKHLPGDPSPFRYVLYGLPNMVIV
ncbi:cilia- and flagella-associated protein 46 [Pelodytes ibericus]